VHVKFVFLNTDLSMLGFCGAHPVYSTGRIWGCQQEVM